VKKSRLRSISKGRQRKRDRGGARGPVCPYVRRFSCAVCGTYKNIDPAHEQRVGRGHGDWEWDSEKQRWRCKVVPLCRFVCHPRYDDNMVGIRQPLTPTELLRVAWVMERCGEQWAEEVGVHLSNPKHPYEQWRELGSPIPGDIIT
jgi:hypothetical protein